MGDAFSVPFILSWSVIILVIKQKRTPATRSSNFVNHSYDQRPNWTPLSPVTITNNNNNNNNNNDGDDDDGDDNNTGYNNDNDKNNNRSKDYHNNNEQPGF